MPGAPPVRLYGPLFASDEPAGLEDLNPDSLEVLEDCRLEPGLAALEPGTAVQFERLGYFAADPDGGFNRTVGLRDGWARIRAREAKEGLNKLIELPAYP